MIQSIEDGRKEDGNKSIADKIIKRLHDLDKTVENNQGRWAWELLQNAKDSIAEYDHRDVSIQIELNESEVEFRHNGLHFTEQDVRGLINQISSTYTTPGDYKVSVEVKDDKGASSKSGVTSVYAGNEAPVVAINLAGSNKSFYLSGIPLKYAVSITDKNDTSGIDPANLFVSVDYVEGFDKAASSTGHQQGQANIDGKNLMFSLDCKSCHKENEKSVGPSYMQVSQKNQQDKNAMNYLVQKIIKGGSPKYW